MTPAPKPPTLLLEAGRADRDYWGDLWRYRELFAILAWRDVAVQYKQTVIGVAWALLRPALTMAVFTWVFGRLAGLPSEGQVPYPLLVMAGMLPWFLMSTILGNGSNSLVANGNLIGKVYFPRLIVPVASSVVALVDFALTLVLLLALMAWFRFMPGWQLLLLPAFMLLAVLAALGPALVLAALNVRYRDFRFVVPFLVQFGLYVSPVGFSSSIVPEAWRLVYALNPAVAVIDGFRWCLLGGQTRLDVAVLATGVLVTLLLLALGLRVFRATERSFADLV
jgi:lipopolysaccharide transport system permease protein